MDQLKEFSDQFYPYMTKAFERSKINFDSLKGAYLISLRPCFGSMSSGVLLKVVKIDSDAMLWENF